MVEERTARHTAGLLYTSGGFRVNFETPWTLRSGRLSPIYVDNRIFQSHPAEWYQVIANMVALMYSEIGNNKIGFVSGGESADFAFSYPVAYLTHKPHIGIRKAEGDHGLGGRLIGDSKAIEKKEGVHVADLITDGGSAIEWIDVLQHEGFQPTDYVVVFDRLQGGREKLASRGVQLHALTQMDERFFQVGIDLGFMSTVQYETEIVPYLENPIAWHNRFMERKHS